MMPISPISAGHASADFLKYLGEPAARSLALGCVAAIALAAFRVKRVSLRLFVWTMALYAALAMPLLGAFLPRLIFAVPAYVAQRISRPAPKTAASPVTTSAARARVRAAGFATATAPAAAITREKLVSAASKTKSITPPRDTASAAISAPIRRAQRRPSISWIAVVLAVYLAVTLVFFARFLLGMFFSRRLEHASEEIDEREALRMLRMRSCMGGLESTPRLAETEKLSVPATLGVLHPVILLPADWREWDEAKLDAVLAHEVSHVARRDALTQRLSLIHRAVFWFSPLAWWIDRQVTELAEEASDEAALAGGADQARYAETLLGFFAELEAAPGRIHWEGVSMAKGIRSAKGCRAERRVERILEWKGTLSMRKSLLAVIVALALPIIFLAASAQPSVAHAQDRPKPPAPPRAGVVAPALPTTPATGVVAPTAMPSPPSPASAPALAGVSAPAAVATPSARPALMPVPGAPEHPPIIPGPIANGPVTPSVMARPAIAPMSGVAPAIPDAPLVAVAPRTPMAAVVAQQSGTSRGKGHGYGYGYGWSSDGPRYVIMTGDSDSVTMSGSEEDVEHARNLRKKIDGDFIWFERDEKSYIITDPAFIAKAKALFAPQEALAKQQDELGRQQDQLSEKQDALGEQMESVKVKVPDITPDLERVRAELKELQASGATQSELGRIQSEIGQLQGQIGRFQSEAGVQQSGIGRQQGELGRQQGELGRRQGELGRQQGELAGKASRELRQMFNDAIAKGVAKPE